MDDSHPPLVVRLSFALELPIAARWHPWAIAEIERRFGPEPSDADRDVLVYRPYDLYPARFPRRSMAQLRSDKYRALGRQANGSPLVEDKRWMLDPGPVLRQLPEWLYPVFPVLVGLLAACLLTGAVAVSLAVIGDGRVAPTARSLGGPGLRAPSLAPTP